VFQWLRPGDRYAQRTKTAKSSIIRELLKLTTNPEIISFAGGLPAPDVFPVQRFHEACEQVLATQAKADDSRGHTPAVDRRGA